MKLSIDTPDDILQLNVGDILEYKLSPLGVMAYFLCIELLKGQIEDVVVLLNSENERIVVSAEGLKSQILFETISRPLAIHKPEQ